jgi:hypothetical protein
MRTMIGWVACATLLAGVSGATAADHEGVLRRLNSHHTVKGTEQSKSYPILFDAYLDLEAPPIPVGPEFNLGTIHPGMRQWTIVADWAEGGQTMADAIIACQNKNILGLPYGDEEVEPKYRQADLVAAIGVGGSLRRNEFRYLDAIDTISAFATAEIYRRMEARQVDDALTLAVSFNWVLRQMCDRQFYEEKWTGIQLLVWAIANLRDVMYLYQDDITAEQYKELAWYDLPGLQPGRERLEIPEGDRIVSEALLEEVFDNRSRADPERFAETFASIQSEDSPFTRFGAAARWRMIAEVHGSLEASKERLKLIYDDWWRRWRIQAYDPLLDMPTQFERTNAVRYAAVIYSMQDIESVFHVRGRLIVSVNAAAVSAGLCAYKKTFGVYPDDQEKTYGQFVRKTISDVDPYDEEYGALRYRLLSGPATVDTLAGRLRVEAGECILYSVGDDHVDGRAAEHTIDGSAGDLVGWPPIRALSRQQGLLD